METDLIVLEVKGENLSWDNELNKFKSEIEVFEKRLGSLVSKSQPKSALYQIEHFQNQFLIQNEAIDELKNEIQKHELMLSRLDHQGFEKVSDDDVMYYQIVAKRIQNQERIYDDLKNEFELFLSTLG